MLLQCRKRRSAGLACHGKPCIGLEFAQGGLGAAAEPPIDQIETGSRCSDGGWMFDGTTLRFSREIATAAPDRPMPLVLRVQP